MSHIEYKQNIKLGAFVLGAIVIFLAAIFYLGNQNNYFNKTFSVSAIFKNVEGLKEGDNVWLSGVKIGTVKKVQIISEGKVSVELSLKDKQNQFIKTDATAYIGSDGLIGNKIVVIRPGSQERVIENGAIINSYSPTDTQELFNIAKEVGTNTRSITDDLKLISARLNKGEGIFGELLHDGPISNDLRSAILSLKSAGDNTNKATNELNLAMHKITSGDGLVTKLLSDTAYVSTFESALNNIAQVGADTKRMSHDLQAVTSKMNSNNNAIGVLLADTLFANKLKTTLDNAQSASVKLDENMEALQHNFLLRGYFKKQKKAEEKSKK
ncbi:MAG TPA: MlaD family protein [Chryseolinea sp.]|nr:MlaD family protein [Chryseolinea sp.]HPH45843.1 MlaD family protein [Chryseolinea sp.]HPM30679.1 MlaD family protein [Chryseolinea sp.]